MLILDGMVMEEALGHSNSAMDEKIKALLLSKREAL